MTASLAHRKKHSVCKLLGGVVRGLSKVFDVTLFNAAETTDAFDAGVVRDERVETSFALSKEGTT